MYCFHIGIVRASKLVTPLHLFDVFGCPFVCVRFHDSYVYVAVSALGLSFSMSAGISITMECGAKGSGSLDCEV